MKKIMQNLVELIVKMFSVSGVLNKVVFFVIKSIVSKGSQNYKKDFSATRLFIFNN